MIEVERRAQVVRDERDELVLEPVRLDQLLVLLSASCLCVATRPLRGPRARLRQIRSSDPDDPDRRISTSPEETAAPIAIATASIGAPDDTLR